MSNRDELKRLARKLEDEAVYATAGGTNGLQCVNAARAALHAFIDRIPDGEVVAPETCPGCGVYGSEVCPKADPDECVWTEDAATTPPAASAGVAEALSDVEMRSRVERVKKYRNTHGVTLKQALEAIKAEDATPTAPAAQAPARVQPLTRDSDRQLMDFYSVETIPDLIDAQERHIVKLQKKLPPLRDESPTNPRIG